MRRAVRYETACGCARAEVIHPDEPIRERRRLPILRPPETGFQPTFTTRTDVVYREFELVRREVTEHLTTYVYREVL